MTHWHINHVTQLLLLLLLLRRQHRAAARLDQTT
jgi:hypothetical protein